MKIVKTRKKKTLKVKALTTVADRVSKFISDLYDGDLRPDWIITNADLIRTVFFKALGELRHGEYEKQCEKESKEAWTEVTEYVRSSADSLYDWGD